MAAKGEALKLEELRADLARLGTSKCAVRADDIPVMLAETRETPFSAKGWIFELKYDGYRVTAGLEQGTAALRYRKGNDATAAFPEVARALRSLPYESLVIDGEAVVLDERGRSSFQRLQKRALLQRTTDIARAAVALPATYFAFDLLCFESYDLRGLPLVERKRLLARILPQGGPLRYLDHIDQEGEAFYREVQALGLEGIVAKKADSTYRGRRHGDWIKIRVDKTEDFVVVGFTTPDGARNGFGSLHLGQYVNGQLVYAGRAGSGFSEAQLNQIGERLERDRRQTPAFVGPMPEGRGHGWVEPRLVAEVRFKEWTEEGLLRQPVFLRLRDDKGPDECVDTLGRGETLKADDWSAPAPPPAPALAAPRDTAASATDRRVPFTNRDKVFWPEEGHTKGDLIEYHRQIAPFLLPYLEDRLLVLTRFPDGITGKSFFQKDAPVFVPAWLRTERIWSDHAEREIDSFVVENVEALLYIINLGTIPLHIWASRIRDLARPDWCVLDLDPKEAPFADVVRVARECHAVAEEIGLPAYCKTSGATGLHVLLPLGSQLTFDECKTLGELLARVVGDRVPDVATTIRLPKSRGGRVYVDFLQNGHGKLLAAPFSARPVSAAKVSTPLVWDEVVPGLDVGRFTIKTVLTRMKELKEDPLRPVLRDQPDLARALARLSEGMR